MWVYACANVLCAHPQAEAQTIEKYVEVFAERYTAANAAHVTHELRNGAETVFLLAFATLMLNTDLHKPNMAHRMSRDQFAHNLRGVDKGADPPRALLDGIYDRISAAPFQPLPDHVAHVLKLERQLVGRHPVRCALYAILLIINSCVLLLCSAFAFDVRILLRLLRAMRLLVAQSLELQHTSSWLVILELSDSR